MFFYMVKTFDLHQTHQTDSSNFYIVDNVNVSTDLASMVIKENFQIFSKLWHLKKVGLSRTRGGAKSEWGGAKSECDIFRIFVENFLMNS